MSLTFPYDVSNFLIKLFGTKEQQDIWEQYNLNPIPHLQFDFKNILNQVWEFVKPFLPIIVVVILIILAFFIVKDILIEIIKTKILEVI